MNSDRHAEWSVLKNLNKICQKTARLPIKTSKTSLMGFIANDKRLMKCHRKKVFTYSGGFGQYYAV